MRMTQKCTDRRKIRKSKNKEQKKIGKEQKKASKATRMKDTKGDIKL